MISRKSPEEVMEERTGYGNPTPVTIEEILVIPAEADVPAEHLQMWLAEDMAQMLVQRPNYLEAFTTYANRMSEDAQKHFKAELGRLQVFIPLTSTLGKQVMEQSLDHAPAFRRSI